ncbi:alpha/beta fold hydrolase [Paraburkholderia acidipaludis]|uniref:alpha/beta fold hydrolase n=1 Tax=Paraburkholderia acidipaludis TaxID=660537 RepID=UPI00146FC4EE|nr:alpha/beta fold hydrolase [Paraburkholderia acidipaludis]
MRHGVTAGTSYSVYASKSDEARATVVLIHGVGMNRSVWAPQIAPLTAANYEVVVYDMLGHGESALPPAEPTLGDYAAQLDGLFDDLRIGRAHVVGHSMGALVALEFALTRAPRTLSVAALNAVYDRTPAQREAVMSRAGTLGEAPLDTGVDATLERWFGDPVPAHLTRAAQAVRHLLLSVNPVGYARTYRLFACSDDVHVGRLTNLAMPALFLTGACDPNSSPEMSRKMAAAAPFGRADVIANARHMMTVSDPEQTNERLLAFLAAAAEPGAANPPNVGERDA